jgi:hypothetical protein
MIASNVLAASHLSSLVRAEQAEQPVTVSPSPARQGETVTVLVQRPGVSTTTTTAAPTSTSAVSSTTTAGASTATTEGATTTTTVAGSSSSPPCPSVDIQSDAFAGIGASGTPSVVTADFGAKTTLTKEIRLSNTVPTGDYTVTVTCRDTSSVVGTAPLRVDPLLPLSQSSYFAEQAAALVALVLLGLVVGGVRKTLFVRKSARHKALVLSAYKSIKSSLSDAPIKDPTKMKEMTAAVDKAEANQISTPQLRRLRHYERTHGRNVFLGKDGRASTSRTIAILWTFILAYIFMVLGFIAVAAASPGLFGQLVGTISPIYLVLLGGPFAAAVGANVIVSTYTASGKSQKSPAGTASVADVWTDDSGSTDLVDSQYTLFNLVAAAIVVMQFVHRPGFGAPEIPAILAGLTGTAAATYLVNKGATQNAPTIKSVTPSVARIGQPVAAYGDNLFAAAATDAKTVVTVGGFEVAADAVDARSDRVRFRVPAPTSGAYSTNQAQAVVIKTVAGATAVSYEGVTVVEDSVAVAGIRPRTVSAGAAEEQRLVTVIGTWLFDATSLDLSGLPAHPDTAAPTLELTPTGAAGTAISITSNDTKNTDSSVTFLIPDSADPGEYAVAVKRGALSSATTPPRVDPTLTVTA